jgi:integrase
MTAREAERFLAAVEDVVPSMVTFFTVAVRAGLRRGELLALRWGDVNLGESEESTDRYLIVL